MDSLIEELEDCIAQAEEMLHSSEKCKEAMDSDQPWGQYALAYADIRAFDLRCIDVLAKVLSADSTLIKEWHVHTLDKAFLLESHIKDFSKKIGTLKIALRRAKGRETATTVDDHPPEPLPLEARSRTPSTHVFLCHASGDKPAVRRLYEQLEADGLQPWLDEKRLLPGQNWKREITMAIRASRAIIVCLSPHSTTKTGFVQKEIRFALDLADERPEGTIFVIPCRLEPCEVPDRLSGWQWVDMFDKDGYTRLRTVLLRHL